MCTTYNFLRKHGFSWNVTLVARFMVLLIVVECTPVKMGTCPMGCVIYIMYMCIVYLRGILVCIRAIGCIFYIVSLCIEYLSNH